MKKSIFGFVALAAMLGATSCSQEADLNGDYGKQKTVTFKVNVDDAVGNTRAISDGSQATALTYQVFDATGMVDQGTATVSNLTAEVEIDLVTGTTYDIAFWAQDPDCEAYNATDLKNVTIDYSKVTNNDESMDAFFANVNLEVTAETQKQEVTLHRPFAQVNVGIADIEGLGIEASSMTIKGQYYNSINLVTGLVGEAVQGDLVYESAAIPTEKLTVTEQTDGDQTTQKEYYYLSMAYVLTPAVAEGNSLLNLEFEFTGSKSYTITKDNVPVNRNYRTNILSTQDMQTISFEITVDPNYTNPDFSNNGNLVPDEAQGETPEQPEPEQVTVSNLDVKVEGDNVTFSADYTGEVTSAYFVCSPSLATRADDDVRVLATAQDGKLSATASIDQFTEGVSYTTTVEVNGEPVEATGEAPAPITPNPEATEPDQPDQPGVEPVTVTYTCTALGDATLSSISEIEVGDVKFSFAKGNGQTAPSYNKAGDIRLYANNVITVNGKNCTVTELEFTLDNTQLSSLTPSEGNVTGLEVGATTATWSGEASTFTLTVGEKAIYWSDTSKAGQFRFKSVKVTYIPN